MVTRRGVVAGALAGAASAVFAGRRPPTWQSLAEAYRVPDWFRRAKFGIWSHWSAQCVPEAGDWYGRLMYMQGDPHYDHHLRHYGHPSKAGFMEIENLWRAEHWDPDALIARYKAAGARYFMALGCHHDNLDTWNSRHHAWNALRVGPKRDIVATWERAARAAGLRFAISNHSAHAWHWYQPAYGYDAEGPLRGQRYDAFRLTKDQGQGTWWEGLDPQELYGGRWFVAPDGIDSIKAMDAWHAAHDGEWLETVPPGARGQAFAAKWLARQKDLVEQYRPDMVYFDDTELPFGPYGLEAAAHYYAQATQWHGRPDVVITGKKLTDLEAHAIVEDVERGFTDHIHAQPWQTDTCIGNWHYDRALFEQHRYKSAKQVVQRLCDVVSKNGNLMLSVPIRGDGTHDSDELAILDELGRWFAANGAGIYDSVPWRRFGEGPTQPPSGMLNEDSAKPFTAADVRFTVTHGAGSATLNAFFLKAPAGEAVITSLGSSALHAERVTMLDGRPVRFRQDVQGLAVTLPPSPRDFVPGLRIEGQGIA
jgi:alpha-L-fucosidase